MSNLKPKPLRFELHKMLNSKLLPHADERADVTVLVPSDDCSRDEGEEEVVVNPYPVTFRARKISAPSKAGWSHDHVDEGM